MVREVVRCRDKKCNLVQFMTVSGNCRKCRTPLKEEVDAGVLGTTGSHNPGNAGSIPAPATNLQVPFDVACAVLLLRKAFGLSSRQLAERMGKYRTYISKVENYKALPTVELMSDFSRAFGITEAGFMTIACYLRNARGQ